MVSDPVATWSRISASACSRLMSWVWRIVCRIVLVSSPRCARLTRRGRQWTDGGSARRDGDDRDRARGLLLVGGVAIAVVVVDDLPQPLVCGVRRLDDPGRALLAPAADLDLHVRVGLEVVQPGRRLVGAAVGGDDEVVVAVTGVDEPVGPGLARAPPGRAQQEGGHADHAVPEAAVGQLVDLLVHPEDLAGDAHGAGAYAAYGPDVTARVYTIPLSHPSRSAVGMLEQQG